MQKVSKSKMKLNRKYTFSNNRQIWRLLLSDGNRLIIEERDVDKKEAFYNCVQAENGKDIFRNFQLDEKYWTGIESVYKEIIFFHKFTKPDMPGHKFIIAYDIDSSKILWQTDKYSFLFIHEDKVYVFRQQFETRDFFTLNYLTGELIDELGDNAIPINNLRESLSDEDKFRNYHFPIIYKEDENLKDIINKSVADMRVEGNLEYILFSNFLLFNFFQRNSIGKLENRFIVSDINDSSTKLDEIILSNANSYVPDSFFLKDNLLFVLKEKTKVEVFEIS